LAPAVDPVATPSGNIYTREFILEYLLSKKKELKRQRAAYEAEQAEAENTKKEEENERQEKKQRQFIDLQEGIVDTTATKSAISKKSAEEVARDVAIGRRDALDDTLKEKLKDHLKSNFWVPDMTPDSGKRKVEKPQERPLSPCTQRPLKVTGIFSINLVKDEAASSGKSDLKYMCPVSQKQITSQKVVAIRSTGTVMLKDCYEKYVKKDLVDPVTQKKFMEKDVVELTSGGTGFAGHEDSQSQGTLHRENMGGC
jgi:nitric oxide synthase-interacting protein